MLQYSDGQGRKRKKGDDGRVSKKKRDPLLLEMFELGDLDQRDTSMTSTESFVMDLDNFSVDVQETGFHGQYSPDIFFLIQNVNFTPLFSYLFLLYLKLIASIETPPSNISDLEWLGQLECAWFGNSIRRLPNSAREPLTEKYTREEILEIISKSVLTKLTESAEQALKKVLVIRRKD